MKVSRRRSWAEIDHDRVLLVEQTVRPKRVDHRGRIAEFLAKNEAKQAQRPRGA